MKIIKIILITIVLLIAVILIAALFVKKDYSVEREVMINKPKQEVFDYIKFIKNQDNFSKWAMMDPKMKKNYTGTDGTVGFISAWESDNKNVGKGEQEIKNITEGERIDLKLHFIKPFDGLADAFMTTEKIGDTQTKVKWGFHSKMKYPMNILLVCMNMDKMVGNDLQQGLDKLKTVLEK